jgi:protease-4
MIVLDHAISERAPDVPWWYAYIPGLKLPLSLEYLQIAMARIAVDPDVRGVVLLLKGAGITLAHAESLAALLARFRRGEAAPDGGPGPAKEVVVHLEQANAAAYLVACAADRVAMPPLAMWEVMGLRTAPTYWKELLDRLGIRFEVVKIAPWKTAADSMTRAAMSEAEREQLNWLLDSLADDVVERIAAGRKLAPEQVRKLIDQAPLPADAALAAGLVDAVAYEDELASVLGRAGQAAKLLPYAEARRLLYRRPQERAEAQVGVLSLEGAIVVGNSRAFPVPLPVIGSKLIGSHTVEQQIRAARKDKRIAAVVVHVDSGGGSALASDLMWRELKLLDQVKPVIVYMGSVAASGGYYVATPGRRVIAHSTTLTGSIGVVIAKGVTEGLRAKIGAHREVIRRGENAGLYTDDAGWTPAQTSQVEALVRHVYGLFKQRVAEGRELPPEALDAIANGRVWTGKQALAHGLVDELGDFDRAYCAACRAANLPEDGSVRTKAITAPRRRLVAEPAAAVQALLGGDVPAGWAELAALSEWLRLLAADPVWLLAADLPRVEG